MDYFKLEINADSKNEAFARQVVAFFALSLSPTLEEIGDIKTATSEAVTNAVVHGYAGKEGVITLTAKIRKNKVHIKISDRGVGIENLQKAMEPFFTTKPEEERSGMGFTIINTFMENVKVKSAVGKGTDVFMTKTIGPERKNA